jgi:hypothetical protein
MFVDRYDHAAQRARGIAGIARDRFADGSIRTALLRIAAHLEAAAAHLEAAAARLDAAAAGGDAVPPGGYEELPSAAGRELFLAEQVAVDHPATRFPAELGQYVLNVLTGRPLPFPHRLRPLHHPFVKREAVLLHALHLLHQDTAMMTEAPDEWLRQVFTVWQQHARMTDEIRADRARPRSQP